MFIHEATRRALQNDGMIYRKSAKGECADVYAKIKPTNSYDTCILVVFFSNWDKKSCRSWNPTADDLIADDWEVSGDKFGNKVSYT